MVNEKDLLISCCTKLKRLEEKTEKIMYLLSAKRGTKTDLIKRIYKVEEKVKRLVAKK